MTPPEQELIARLLLAFLPIGLIVYARLGWLAVKKGGQVKTDTVAQIGRAHV